MLLMLVLILIVGSVVEKLVKSETIQNWISLLLADENTRAVLLKSMNLLITNLLLIKILPLDNVRDSQEF